MSARMSKPERYLIAFAALSVILWTQADGIERVTGWRMALRLVVIAIFTLYYLFAARAISKDGDA